MCALGGLALLAGLVGWAHRAFESDLPTNLSVATDHRPLRASRVFSASGELIGEFFVEQRVLLPLADIPAAVKQAFIAAEDAEFYRHGGVDYLGGATITQQVARLLIPGRAAPERREKLLHKLRESLLALRLERALSKDEILGIHLNHVYLGHGAYGVAAGASAYFGKAARDLTAAEAALLAGLPRAPSRLTPLPGRRAIGVAAPYFVEAVRRYVAERYGGDELLFGGLRIQTTLDLHQQRAAAAAVSRGLSTPGIEGALVALDPATGHLLAMVGGRDFDRSPIDHATEIRRPIGTTVEPFIYAEAIDRGMTPVTHLGQFTLRAAFARGVAPAASQVIARFGVDALVDRMRALGVTSALPRTPALAQGSADLSLAEVAYALAALPAGGKRVDPVSILRITDAEGQLLEDHTRPPPRNARLSPETAYIVTDMMRAAIESGAGERARALDRPVAGVTGISPGRRDAWFFGFTPELLCGVWVGREDAAPAGQVMPEGQNGITGQVAAPIGLEFMQAALGEAPAREFPVPPGVVLARANPETGAPAPPSQFRSRLIPFKRGTLPPAFTKAGRFTEERF
jgi:membrane carboxypeptidase/penicillin-binding protein